MPPDVVIRAAGAIDVPALHAVEARASRLFADHGFPLVGAAPWPIDDFAGFLRDNATLVATDVERPVGFAVSGPVDDLWWLKELSVDPDFMGRGFGTALIEAVCAEARGAQVRRLGLSTFRDVPFNAPFYARRGFRVMNPDTAPEAWRNRFESEVPDGASRADRVLMIRELYT
ncbi:GNAT family N-acetyltransferase [Oricola sp.]|uniref:GNAT family N-acetyltransferase n=1 Tax=Oricola sp. TaxID=1979950 RepID=UPI0025F4D4E4|nr:GNAT family N-acetyltransferase [Oricola sp.]MCI5077787.1 GNAT family N-acetyltransferase [Oricola sp.]